MRREPQSRPITSEKKSGLIENYVHLAAAGLLVAPVLSNVKGLCVRWAIKVKAPSIDAHVHRSNMQLKGIRMQHASK